MEFIAHFTFLGSLTDFPAVRKKTFPLTYRFDGNPSIKDAIEALGVPHVEVALVRVSDEPCGFEYRLRHLDRVIVYPKEEATTFPAKAWTYDLFGFSARFIADVHLGSLCVMLRLLGFDTAYSNSYTDSQIASLAAAENRTVLTRDVGLLKHKAIVYGYWLRSQHSLEQTREVVRYFSLGEKATSFSRCLTCNGSIRAVPREQVIDTVPPRTRMLFSEFYQCQNCGKVYWKGSHYERMLEQLKLLR